MEYFDRWANSVGAAMEFEPHTKDEFLYAVTNMTELSRDAK